MSSAPLSEREFTLAVRAGRGSAHLDVRAHPEIDRTALLVDACLHDGTYDRQSEGTRGAWTAALVRDAGCVDRVSPEVARGLRSVPDDGQALRHVLEVLVEFARFGHSDARAAVIAELDSAREHEVFELARSAVDVAGLSILPSALQRLACAAARNVSEYDAGLWFHALVAEHGVDAISSACRAAQASTASTPANEPQAGRVARLCEWLETTRRAQDAGLDGNAWPALEHENDAPGPEWRTEELLPFKSVRFDDLDWTPRASGETFAWPARTQKINWARKAPAEDLERARAAFAGERDPSRLELLLTIFRRRDLPHVDETLVALAEHEDPRVAKVAAEALGRVRDERVHAAALSRIERGLGDASTASLLANNWQPGDAARLVRVLPREPEREFAHDIGYDLAENGPPLEHSSDDCAYLWVYEHTPCAMCRECAVKKLARAGKVPAWMRAEIAWDAREELRELAKAGGGLDSRGSEPGAGC